jgi:mRNA-degrading endonuclease RelE of RelBE toxin-antitoxin system
MKLQIAFSSVICAENKSSSAGCEETQRRDAWRIRAGDYRVIYEIHDRILQIIVITVGHRREIYS